MKLVHIAGSNRGYILLFALSTCAWCKKTKRFLDELGVDYYYIDVDLLDGEERRHRRINHELSEHVIIPLFVPSSLRGEKLLTIKGIR